MKYVIIVITMLFSQNLLAYDCKDISLRKDYNKSDIVFIGKVIDIDSIQYTIKVYDVLKGVKKEIIKAKIGKGEGLLQPKLFEEWLFFGKENDSGILIYRCGNSRSFSSPRNTNMLTIINPLKPNQMIDNEVLLKEIRKYAGINEVFYEILLMQNWSLSESLNKSNRIIYIFEKELKQLKFLYIIILVFMLVITILIIRKK